MATFTTRKRRLVWIAMVLVTAALVIALYFQLRRSPAARRAVYITGNAERGAELFYGEKQCGICHSVNGNGGRVAPELSGTRPETPAMGWLAAVLWNHGPGMWRQIRQANRPFPELSAQEMADMLEFLFQASSLDGPGNKDTGERVFAEKGCSHCHSVRGTGGSTAPDLSAVAAGGDSSAWTGAMLNHAGSMVGPITSTLGQWPQFSGSEMNDLIAFVGAPGTPSRPSQIGDNAPQGWSVFQRRCIQCHSVRGQGGTAGPELGPDHDMALTTAQLASVMWNHAPAMLRQGRANGIPPAQLQGTEVADLLAFLASLRYFEPTGSAFLGERVFAERGCAACHGSRGEGTKAGPALRADGEAYTAVSFTAALWRHGPRMIDRAEERGLAWPTLKATDIGDLVSFLNASANSK